MDGGAAIAACRLTDVLNRHGVQATLLVRDKQSSRPTTHQLPKYGWRGLKLRFAFLWERFCVWTTNFFHRKGLWAVDLGIGGASVVGRRDFREADIIHLHWVNQGLLSLSELRRILRSGKPVVWTMHDMWPCTGICHHARECVQFHTHCMNCPRLHFPSRGDRSFLVYDRKAAIYPEGRLVFVGCSKWMADEARKSRLTSGNEVLSIPNTYNHNAFCPGLQMEGRLQFTLPRSLKLILFASQKVTNPRKGLDLLLQALNTPVIQKWQGKLGIVVVGQMADEVAARIPYPLHPLTYIKKEEEMAALYRAADVFVTPSLEENLPNTIMESMACGTPCVGFEIGGIPEMIDHQKNGYVARYRDAEDLAAGIDYVLSDENHDRLGAAAAAKAEELWNEDMVAKQYIDLYEHLLS